MIPDKRKLEDFARGLLVLRGAVVRSLGKGLLDVKLSRELGQKLGRESVLLAFSEEAAVRNEEAELVTPGSYFFSVLLSLARERGTVCRMVAREKTRGVSAFAKQMKAENFGVEIVEKEGYYHWFVRFHFLLSYCTVDSNHEIRSVLYDTTLRKVSSEADGCWERVTFENKISKDGDVPPMGHDDVMFALREASSYLIARVKHKAFALKARSSTLLENELKRLETYYRNLIQEEGTSAIEAGTRNPRDTERAETCKLEWQRKAATEAIRFWPRVRFSLMGLEEICLPRSLLTLRVNAHPFTEFYGVFDRASGTTKGAFCQGCNGLSMHLWVDKSGAVLCEDCFSQVDK